MSRLVLGLIVAMSLSAIGGHLAFGADSVRHKRKADTVKQERKADTITHEGKIVKVDNGQIAIQENKKDFTAMVGSDTKVTVDGKQAKLSDLKSGLHAKLDCKKDGTKLHVVSIRASKA